MTTVARILKFKTGFALLLLLVGWGAVPCMAAPASADLVVYTYDSILAQGGLGPAIFPLFEKKCGCRVRAVSLGDGGQLLSRLESDRRQGKVVADLVLGIDTLTFAQGQGYFQSWGKWKPKSWKWIRSDRQREAAPGFLPLDFGYLAFIADSEVMKRERLSLPTKLSDLLAPQWRRNIILEDPRTSLPGLGFVLWVDSVMSPSAFQSYFTGLKTQWLTLAPGWDSAYQLFLKKEAPLVWSYTTSQAYHQEHGEPGRFAVMFDEGQPLWMEGTAWVNTAHESRVKEFFEFLLSEEVQKLIPRTNWMLPVRKGVKLPVSFQNLPEPKKVIHFSTSPSEVDDRVKLWKSALQGR